MLREKKRFENNENLNENPLGVPLYLEHLLTYSYTSETCFKAN